VQSAAFPLKYKASKQGTKAMDMLGILAQSLMIATRTEDRMWMRDAEYRNKLRRDRYFWQGRKWRQIDPNDL
jgi:hypothetical protein